MEDKFFLTQIQRANDGTFTKGVVVKDSLNAASIVDDRRPVPLEPEE